MKNLLLITCFSLFGCAHLMNEPDATTESLEAQYYQQQIQRSGGKFTFIPEINDYIEEVGQKVSSCLKNEETYHYTILNNPTPMAWGLPGGHIGISIGLLHKLESEAQLAAVIAHEIGHIQKKHYEHTANIHRGGRVFGGLLTILAGLAIGIPLTSTDLSAGWTLDENGDARYFGTNILMHAGEFINKFISDNRIQEYEYEADERAIEILNMTTYPPSALLDALAHFKEQKAVSNLLAYTQNTNERIKRLREKLLPKASFNKSKDTLQINSKYRKATQKLHQKWPAYEYYQTAFIAINEYFDADRDIDDLKYALDAIDNAIKIQPRNALFHEAKGVILAALLNTTDALKSYETAIYLNPNYYRNYIHTGTIHYNNGRRSLAKRHFQKSFDLLPTATAQKYLAKYPPWIKER